MIGRAARGAFFGLLPAVGVGGALAVPVLMCLAGALSFRPSLVRQALEKRPPTLLFLLLFLALAMASAVWSEHAAGLMAIKIAVLGLFGILFAAGAAGDPRLTQAGGLAAFAVLAILLSIEALGGLPLNRAAQPQTEFDELARNTMRGASLLVALTWSAAAILIAQGGRRWTRLGLLALAAGGFVSFQFDQSANALGFAAGLIAFALAFIAPRTALLVTFVAVLAWLVAAPFISPFLTRLVDPVSIPYSWNHRLEIWSYVCERIREQPWVGHGLDAARNHHPPVPVHPHSASLQIWFETGMLGVLVTAALIISGAVAVVRWIGNNRPAAAAAAGTLATVGVITNLSFNFWAEWWLATLFVVAGVVGALAPARLTRRGCF